MTWNGTSITGPVLIYKDEILVDDPELPFSIGNPNRGGALICRSENQASVGWYLTNGRLVSVGDFKQIKTEQENVSRLSGNREGIAQGESYANGLWTCRDSRLSEVIPVGIYEREGGEYLVDLHVAVCEL